METVSVRNKRNGGILSRMGLKFHHEIEAIKDARLINGTSRERVSTEKITNLIIRHKHWKGIFEDLVKASEEEVNEYGL